MSKVSLGGSPTGTATFDIVAPATNTNRTITLPDSSGQVSVLDLRAAQTASGTAVDFLNIPATARRVTVIFNKVSTNGTSNYLIQLGAGSVQTTGYDSAYSQGQTGVVTVASTQGHISVSRSASAVIRGQVVFSLVSGNSWVGSGILISTVDSGFSVSGSDVTLSGPLDRIRITTANGTDVFDAGSISIMVE